MTKKLDILNCVVSLCEVLKVLLLQLKYITDVQSSVDSDVDHYADLTRACVIEHLAIIDIFVLTRTLY